MIVLRRPDSMLVALGRRIVGRRYRRLRALRHCERGGYSLAPYDRLKCIFVHVPKAAGVSVAQALFGGLGGGHHTVDDYRCAYSAAEFESYFKFTFVRNPWDRVLSAYSFLQRGGFDAADSSWAREKLGRFSSFEAFVRGWLTEANIWTELHFFPQYYFITIGGRVAVDFVGRVETIERDFGTVTSRLGLDATLPHLNRSGERNYREWYSEKLAHIVADVYRTDIDLLGYKF